MNLDYRKGDVKLEDLNSDHSYDAGEAFNQSQLANMLLVQHLAELWREDNIAVNGVSTKAFVRILVRIFCFMQGLSRRLLDKHQTAHGSG